MGRVLTRWKHIIVLCSVGSGALALALCMIDRRQSNGHVDPRYTEVLTCVQYSGRMCGGPQAPTHAPTSNIALGRRLGDGGSCQRTAGFSFVYGQSRGCATLSPVRIQLDLCLSGVTPALTQRAPSVCHQEPGLRAELRGRGAQPDTPV